MKDWIREILDRYGQTATVRTNEGERSVHAFLQPVTEKNEREPDGMCAIGALDGRLWLYLGQTELSAGDSICWNGLNFRVRSGRSYHLGEELLYWWASLEQEREAAE